MKKYADLELDERLKVTHAICEELEAEEEAQQAFSGLEEVPEDRCINPLEDRSRYPWNDIGCGNLFADSFRDICRYVPEAKNWYYYDGKAWRLDVGKLVVSQQAKILTGYLLRLGATTQQLEDGAKEQFVKFALQRQQRKYRDTMLRDAESVYPISINEFDKNPHMFNCSNGTLNLQTMQFEKPNSTDLLSKIANVHYEPDVCCERWEQFINEIFCGDGDLARFFQKSAGYCLTGDTSQECLFILFGPTTRNGKGVCTGTIVNLMGDYAATAQAETLAEKLHANSSNASEDVARLKGARLVNVPEPKIRLKLDEAKVKQFTGGDRVTARFLHENSFEFLPQWKWLIHTNHLPTVKDNSLFGSGRVHVIPFNRHFKQEERDTTLKTFFMSEDSKTGVLNWILEGYRLYMQEGFASIPAAVKSATDEYKQESDIIGQFIAENLTECIGNRMTTAEVHTAYTSWCYLNNYKPLSSRNFVPEIRTRLNVERNNRIGNYVAGQMLIKDFPQHWDT